MSLMMNISPDLCVFITGIASLIVAIVGIIASIWTYVKNYSTHKKEEILKRYEKIYSDVFKLRKEVSNILGVEWYYEVEPLIDNYVSRSKVVEHLNEICELCVSFIDNKSAQKLWLDLMPLEMFKRLFALYPFVLYERNRNKDNRMFFAYMRLMKICCNSKAIKKTFFNSSDIFWVGIRKSDIKFSQETVKDGVFVFDKCDTTNIRTNQNIQDVYSPLINQIYTQSKLSPQNKIMMYNSKLAYALRKEVRGKVTCLNPEDVIKFYNNKIETRRKFAQNGIKIIPWKIYNGKELDYGILQNQFDCKQFVIQKACGGGGYGSFLLNSENKEAVLDLLKRNDDNFIVSPYVNPNISVNIHVLICDKQTLIFPGSIQIIETHNNQLLYRGADFIAFRELSAKIRHEIHRIGMVASSILRNDGYRGIAGFDMLISNNAIFFLEVNPRFQASSFILDRYISDKRKKKNLRDNNEKQFARNLLELNERAFSGVIDSDILYTDEINYSCYYYYDDGIPTEYINEKLKLLQSCGVDVDTDGYTQDTPLNFNSYCFRATFNEKIVQISPDGDIWLSDNVRLSHFAREQTKLDLKIALLNQGVRLGDNVMDKTKSRGVFDAVDFYVEKYDFYVNSPIDTKMVRLSPYSIERDFDGNCKLYFYNDLISVVVPDENIINANDPQLTPALFRSTDRLRITPSRGCQYKTDGLGCEFCNVSPQGRLYSANELIRAADIGLKTNPRHIMIGGGTIKNMTNINDILQLVGYIHQKHNEMEISLMSVPPKSTDLERLKNAGVTDVSFNMEVYDEKIAKKLMPAKSEYKRSEYFNTLKTATNIWTEYGAVRTILIVGLEPTKSLLFAIEKLNNIKVQPVLSVFRPLRGSKMYDRLPPTNEYLKKIYDTTTNLLKKTDGYLGPKCCACRNNTLSI